MGRIRDDLRIAARTLGRARGFTAAVVATLAIALALETAVIAVVNAYLVRSLPYPGASRLYQVFYAPPNEFPPDGLEELDWSALSDVIEHPLAWDLDMFYLLGGDHPEAAPGAWVTPGFMQGLGVRPALGRAFADEEFRPGGPQVAMISHSLWRERFGGDSAVLGRPFGAYVSDRPRDPEVFTIVGVLPPDFWHFNRFTQVFTPLRAPSYPYHVRLREDVPVAVAEQRITAFVRAGVPSVPPAWRVQLRSTHGEYSGRVRPMLVAIATAVTLVLLIACANVALLMLLRGMRRQKEIAVRLALGAGPGRVARVLLSESLLLSIAAASGGSALALLLVKGLGPAVQRQLGRPAPGGESAVSIDVGVMAAVGALTILISAALTLVPLLATSRTSLFATLRRGRHTGGERPGGRRMRFGLIALEVAGSLTLLVACGLMVRTVVRMLDVDLGIRHDGVVSTTVAIRERSYPDAASRIAFYERLLGRLAAVAGVGTVALSSPSPLATYNPRPVRADDAGDGPVTRASTRAITAEYTSMLGIATVRGRSFTPLDRGGSEPVAIVSETAANRLWPRADAVGRRVMLVENSPVTGDTVTVTRTVVGVVRDVRESPTDDDVADVYVPLVQSPGRFASIVVRAAPGSGPALAELRRVVALVDREATVGTLQRLEDAVGEQLARPRFLASLFAGFGVFALLLGVVGLYAVIAYAVSQREHEVAVRMAVGADSRAIVRLFLREGVMIVVFGVVAGVLGAVAIGRVLESQLFGVRAVDVGTLVVASLTLATASLAAAWWPARRASRTDPVIALKDE